MHAFVPATQDTNGQDLVKLAQLLCCSRTCQCTLLAVQVWCCCIDMSGFTLFCFVTMLFMASWLADISSHYTILLEQPAVPTLLTRHVSACVCCNVALRSPRGCISCLLRSSQDTHCAWAHAAVETTLCLGLGSISECKTALILCTLVVWG
jgi:hypothetical protein